jgi:hypothetical protein
VRFAEVGALRGDFEEVAGDFDLHRVRLLAANERGAMHALLEELALQLDALMRLFRNDLIVVRVVTFDDF